MVTVPLAGCVLVEMVNISPSSSVSLFKAQIVTRVFIVVSVASSFATGFVGKSLQSSATITFTKMVSQAPVSSHPVTSITSFCKKPGSGVYSTQLPGNTSKPQSKVVCKLVTCAVASKVQKFTQNSIGVTGSVHKLSGLSHGCVGSVTVIVTVASSQLPSSSHTVYVKVVVPV